MFVSFTLPYVALSRIACYVAGMLCNGLLFVFQFICLAADGPFQLMSFSVATGHQC